MKKQDKYLGLYWKQNDKYQKFLMENLKAFLEIIFMQIHFKVSFYFKFSMFWVQLH